MTTAVVILAGLAAIEARQAGRDRLPAPGTGTAIVRGQVFSLPDDRPLRRAVVLVTSSVPNRFMAITDDNGRFELTGLPAGRYTVSTSRPGWVTTFLGARRAYLGPGTPLVIGGGEERTLRLTAERGAVIAGTVRDWTGRPAPGVRVDAAEYRMVNGLRTLMPAPGPTVQTDDRGEYRLYGLPAGEYLVVATGGSRSSGAGVRPTREEDVRWASTPGSGTTPPPPSQPLLPAPTYYGASTHADLATRVRVFAGEVHPGVDIELRRQRVARIDGVVVLPDGRPAAQINLRAAGGTGTSYLDRGMATAVTNAEGRFLMEAVRPGTYTVVARASGMSLPPDLRDSEPLSTLWLSETIAVDGEDVSGLSLRLSPGLVLSGRVDVERSPSGPTIDVTRLQLRLVTRGGNDFPGLAMPNGAPDAAGAFTLRGVVPGRYALTVSIPGSTGDVWTVRSAMSGGIDLLDPFDVHPGADRSDIAITMTHRVSELTGAVLNRDGAPAPGYTIFVFPVDRSHWVYPSRRLRSHRPGTDGRFTIRGLPSGEYYLALLTDTSEAELADAAFLEELSAASVTVSIREGETTRQDVGIR